MPRSKLGTHINALTDRPGQLAFFNCQPAVAKILQHERPFVQEAQVRSPQTLWIGRVYRDLSQQRDLIARCEDGADSLFKIIEGQATSDLIPAWEGLNEIGPHPTHDYMRFEIRLAERLHQAGKKYVAGSWSTGCPDMPDWRSNWILEVLRVADYIGVHEYCAPDMRTEFWLYQNDAAFRAAHDTNDPVPITPTNGGFFTLRYRRWYPKLPADCKKPLLITETGVDSGACPHGYEHLLAGRQGGWRSFTDPPGYLAELQWYDSFLQQDPYVVGATIYCDGTHDPTWNSFDVRGDMANMTANYIRQSQQGPSPGAYQSHYVLLPQGSQWPLYEALRNYILTFRVTMGQSHDDAAVVHGTLGHTVTMVNPSTATIDTVRQLAPSAQLDIFRGSLLAIQGEFDRRATEGKRFG